jgi:hypothetical protein
MKYQLRGKRGKLYKESESFVEISQFRVQLASEKAGTTDTSDPKFIEEYDKFSLLPVDK